MLTFLLLLVLGQNPSSIAVEGSAEWAGSPVRITVSSMGRAAAESAIGAALDELERLETLLDPGASQPASLGALNRGAGEGPVALDAELLEILTRAHNFCIWSEGVTGALGGPLYAAWGARGALSSPPGPEALAEARSGLGCDHLGIDPVAGTAELAAGSQANLLPFAAGGAVDRAIEILRGQGVSNGLVEVGGIRRALGPGPYGDGWPVHPPAIEGLQEPLPTLWLRDRALAVLTREDGPFVDLRTGTPAAGPLAVLAGSELAVEAQGLAVTMFITGSRDGQLRLGSLSPRPAVLWVLGSGSGPPLLVEYRWSDLSRSSRLP